MSLSITPLSKLSHTKPILSKLALTLCVGLLCGQSVAATSDAVNTMPPLTVTSPPPLQSISSQDLNAVVAAVNGTPILASDIARAIQLYGAELNKRGLPVDDQDKIVKGAFNRLINRTIQLEMMARSGYYIDNQTLNKTLQKVAQDQGYASLTELQQALDSKRQGSYAELRNQLREDLSLRQFQEQQLASKVSITNQDIDMFLQSPESGALKQSSYHTLHILVPYLTDDQSRTERVAQAIASYLKLPDVTVQEAIDSVQANYPLPIQGGDMGLYPKRGLPPEFADDIIALNVGDVTSPLPNAQGLNVIKLIDKQVKDELIIDQWRVRHILIKSDANQSSETAKQRINQLYQQIRQGNSDFATLASTYSDDPGSAGKGGDLGWVSAGDMVPSFDEKMQQTTVGDYSIPFESDYGWHILKVEDKRKADVSKKKQREQAQQIIYQRQSAQALENWLQEIQRNAYIKIYDDNLKKLVSS